jgi:hypothetical protein
MLFLLFGSSAAGKTAALRGIRERMPDVCSHDFDEIGVPPDADTAWRQRKNEEWVRRALDRQLAGDDFLLSGQTPLGEVLATPSAAELDGISACLLDCDDQTRLDRIRARGPEWLERVPGELQDYLNWAEWMRRHARNPRWRQDVIRSAGAAGMRWDRWTAWHEGDPRWRVRVVDTSTLTIDAVANELARWIADERELLRSGSHPLGAIALRHLDPAPRQRDA